MSLPVGPLVSPREAMRPTHEALHGQTTSLVPLEAGHAAGLYKNLGGPENHARWTYMLTGGFDTLAECQRDIEAWSGDTAPDRLYYAVLSGPAASGAREPEPEPEGIMCYLAVEPGHRRLEIGGVVLGAALQRTRRATEAFYLLIRHAFEDLGYLRVEWKANRLNEASLRAAERLGFTFEGVFRKHMVVKGRERDTAWFSMTDGEWARVKKGFEAWLDDGNFDCDGRQRRGLRECREG